MEKRANIPQKVSNTIHPSLSVYLSGNFANQPNPTSNTQPEPRPEEFETKSNRCYAYFRKLYKNRIQTSSVTGGYLQLSVSGLHIAWGLWRLDFKEPWFTAITGAFVFVILSFFVGAIVGGIVAGFIVNIWRKQAIYYLCGSLMVISSLILIIWCNFEVGIIFGRVMAGLSHGIVYNVVVIHAGENAHKEVRGIIISTINCLLWLSIFIGSLLIATVQMGISTTISSDRMIGIFGLGFSVLAIIYTMFCTYESIVFLMSHGKLGEALELITTLRNEDRESISISDDFEELRLMVNQDKQETGNIFRNNNSKILALMVALKLLQVLTNNFIINWIMMMIFVTILPAGSRRMSPVILTAVRFFSSILQVLIADLARRKQFFNVFCTLTGTTLLILEVVLISVSDFTFTTNWVAAALCIIIQFLVAFAIDPLPHVILSEAFATSKKNWSVSFTTIFENAAQTFFVGICFIDGINFEYKFHIVLFATVTCILGLFLILVLFLPETRGLSLKEARDSFRNITNRCLRHE